MPRAAPRVLSQAPTGVVAEERRGVYGDEAGESPWRPVQTTSPCDALGRTTPALALSCRSRFGPPQPAPPPHPAPAPPRQAALRRCQSTRGQGRSAGQGPQGAPARPRPAPRRHVACYLSRGFWARLCTRAQARLLRGCSSTGTFRGRRTGFWSSSSLKPVAGRGPESPAQGGPRPDSEGNQGGAGGGLPAGKAGRQHPRGHTAHPPRRG